MTFIRGDIRDRFGLQPAGLIRPRHSRSIADSRCGVGCETLDRDLFDYRPVFPQMGELGVKWARLQTGWAKCERQKGVYDFAWLDDQVNCLLTHGIKPWFCVSYGNPLYAPEAAEGYQTVTGYVPVGDPEAERAWVHYVKALVSHFKDRVTHYEIWNEPENSRFWANLPRTGADYARLFDLTVPAVKEVFPEARIIAVGATHRALLPEGRAWLRDFLQNVEDPGVIDILTFHSYRYPPERDYEEGVRLLRALLAEFNPRIVLWQGESGYPSVPSGTGSRAYWNETSETIQAKWLTRHVLFNLGMGIGLVSWHQAIDLIGHQNPKMVNPKGLLRGADASRKPSFYAYQRICSLTADEAAAVTRRWGAQVDSSTFQYEIPGIRGYHFANGRGGRMFAYWQDGPFGESLRYEPVALQLEGDWSSALLADPLSGAVYHVEGEFDEGKTGLRLPITDYALILCTKKGFDHAFWLS